MDNQKSESIEPGGSRLAVTVASDPAATGGAFVTVACHDAQLGEEEIILEPGERLGKYRIIRHLDSGAMGHVYEAEHTMLRKRHALKVIRQRYATMPAFVSKFRYEARVLAALEHPNIVRVTDYGHAEEHHFFVMDYIIGADGRPHTLQDLLGPPEQMKPLPDEDIRSLFLQICAALSYSHQFGDNGIVHRDLKPSNILLRESVDPDRRVAVADFGLARMVGVDDGLASMVLGGVCKEAGRNEVVSGTPRFMSPEQWQVGSSLGPQVDIYAVGVMLYTALTGRFPYPDSRVLLDLEERPALRKPSHYGRSRKWDAVVMKCLAADPEDRYASASDLAESISGASAPPGSRRTVLAATALLLLAATATWIFPRVRSTVPESTPATPGNTAIERVGEPIPAAAFEPAREEPPTATPRLAPVPFRLYVEPAPDHPRAAQLPIQGRLRLDGGEWETISLPYAALLDARDALRVELDVEGYESPPAQEMQLRSDIATDVVFQLVPSPARITLTSNADDARVVENGTDVGRVGEQLILEPFKRHRLLVTSPTYKDRIVELDLREGAKTHADYYVALDRLPARLIVHAHAPDDFKSPRRAEILVNGRSLGEQKLPYTTDDLPEGHVTLEVRAPGFKVPQPQTAELEYGSVREVPVNLEFLDSFMQFNVTPPDARIFVGGQVVENGTKLQITPEAIYAIRIEAAGYKPVRRTEAIQAGETRTLHATLQPYTFFEFETDPPDAGIFMEGKRLNAKLVKVQPGKEYLVNFRAKGYKACRAQYTADEGTTRKISVKMKRKLLSI